MVMGEGSRMMECNNGKARLGYLCFSLLLLLQGISPVLFFVSHFYMVWWESLRTLALGEEISNHTQVNDTILDVRKPFAPVLLSWHPPPAWTASLVKPWLITAESLKKRKKVER